MDRILGIFFSLIALASAVMVFVFFSFSWSWVLLVLLTISLGYWVCSGLKKIEVGWKGLLLFLGGRTSFEMEEGWHWVPFPFGFKTADCRKQTLDLEVLEATTIDNVKVFVGGSVVYRVVDLDIYFNAEKQDLENWIDNTRKQVIRTRVRELPQADVLNMHDDLGKEMETALRDQGSDKWGVEILQVIMPEISPDPEVAKDLALLERENLQRKGQEVEFQFGLDLVNKAMLPAPLGAGLTKAEALERLELTIGKATKVIDGKTVRLDRETVEAINAFLGRK